MARKRDYKAEYERRIASAATRGLSRSQGRGHARAGEAPIKSRPSRPDDQLEAALRELRKSRNQAAAAKSVGVSPERLRRYLRESVQIEGRGRTLKITDNRKREMTVISDGEARERLLPDFDQASLNGRHLAAVGNFITSNDPQFLAEFVGQSVIDAKGKAHPLETDPNTLYRLAAVGSEVFHEIYRLIHNGV